MVFFVKILYDSTISTVLVLILTYVGLTTAQSFYLYHFCIGDYDANNSIFNDNLGGILGSLSTREKLHYRGYFGSYPDRVYVLIQCRGDVTSNICSKCATTAIQYSRVVCPNYKEAIIWYDECMIRYSNQSFFSVMQANPEVYLWKSANITNNWFNAVLVDLMDDIVSRAVSGSSDTSTLFAYGDKKFMHFQKVYGLVQCTSDIDPTSCKTCLQGAAAQIPKCCDGKQGGRVLRPSCYLRYETYPFIRMQDNEEDMHDPPSSLILPQPINDDKKNRTVIIITAVLVGTFFTASVCAFFTRRWLTQQRGNKQIDMESSSYAMDNAVNEESSDSNMLGDTHIFEFWKLAIATNNFDIANKLGEGGFGSVYKGRLPDGQEIAVKRLSKTSIQGLEEFKNEVVVISKLQHRNLVKLLGCCIKGRETMLIYEYMPNKSLDAFLFDPLKRQILNWRKRFQIIEGIARGILYLHRDSRLRVIHRDLKASNILLDEELKPKISDFGMARIFNGNELQGNTRKVAGTYGYMSPEYAMRGLFSEKSDVFSFGVLLLEIVSGMRTTSFYHEEESLGLLGYAWLLWNEDKMQAFIDPILWEPGWEEEIFCCIHVGLLCVQELAKDRPTMSSIISMITSEIATLPTPTRPAFTEQHISVGSETNDVTISSITGR